jgi:hypothetical protein
MFPEPPPSPFHNLSFCESVILPISPYYSAAIGNSGGSMLRHVRLQGRCAGTLPA